jgi:hypothetical protein
MKNSSGTPYEDDFDWGIQTERQRIIELITQEIEKQSIIEMYNYTAKRILSQLERACQ